MEYRNLGRTGVKVSPLCLCCIMFGGWTSEADSMNINDDPKIIMFIAHQDEEQAMREEGLMDLNGGRR